MNTFRCLLLLIVCFTLSIGVLADTEEFQTSYSIKSTDREFTFVMLGDENILHLLTEVEKENEILIRQRYRSSGLYLSNDNTYQPLFTISWYSHQVFLGADNIHLVKMGPWSQTKTDEAFAFFEKDKLLKSYQVADLVDFEWFLPHSVSHFRWAKGVHINDAENTFEVKTLLYDEFVFDVDTGQMISERRYSRILVAVMSTLFLALFVLMISILRRKKRRIH